MSWLFLAIVSYFFSALSQIIDKILLHTRLPSPATYAFFTCISSALVIVLLPFGISFLPISVFLLAMLAGIMFVPAIYLLFFSLRRCDVSRIVPIVGGAVPIFLFIISFLWYGQMLSYRQLIATIFFILGGLILATEAENDDRVDSFVSHLFGVNGKKLKLCDYESGKGIFAAIMSALFFALTYFLSKEVYAHSSPFLSEFFWIRMGSALGALGMLFYPAFRKSIVFHTPQISSSSAGVIMANKVIGAAGFFLLNMSFSATSNHGSVIIINALKGLEHLFVFILSLFLSLMMPSILSENFDYHTIILKLMGIAFIGFGFVYLL